jgi:hypothetical protein
LQYAEGMFAQGQTAAGELFAIFAKSPLYWLTALTPIAALMQLMHVPVPQKSPSVTPTQSESDAQDWL